MIPFQAWDQWVQARLHILKEWNSAASLWLSQSWWNGIFFCFNFISFLFPSLNLVSPFYILIYFFNFSSSIFFFYASFPFLYLKYFNLLLIMLLTLESYINWLDIYSRKESCWTIIMMIMILLVLQWFLWWLLHWLTIISMKIAIVGKRINIKQGTSK